MERNPFGEECPPTNYDSYPHSHGEDSICKTLLCSAYYSTGCGNDNCRFAHGLPELCQPRCYKEITPDMGITPTFRFPKGFIPGTPDAKKKAVKRVSISRFHAEGFYSSLVSDMSKAVISIEDDELDPRMQYIKLEGTCEQVEVANYLVQDYLQCFRGSSKRDM